MNYGILRVQSFVARLAGSLPEVAVTVESEQSAHPGTWSFTTDEEGNAPDLELWAPSEQYSLEEDNTAVLPYSTYTLSAQKAGYQPLTIHGVQIFSCQVTLAQLELTPIEQRGAPDAGPDQVDIPTHRLFSGDGGSGHGPVENCQPRILEQPIIPEKITVHLGRPAASARNVTVSFKHYIANVASSEVYPTWVGSTTPTIPGL